MKEIALGGPTRNFASGHSRSRWLGVGDLIAELEGPSFISTSCAAPCGPATLVTQNPWEKLGGLLWTLLDALPTLAHLALVRTICAPFRTTNSPSEQGRHASLLNGTLATNTTRCTCDSTVTPLVAA